MNQQTDPNDWSKLNGTPLQKIAENKSVSFLSLAALLGGERTAKAFDFYQSHLENLKGAAQAYLNNGWTDKSPEKVFLAGAEIAFVTQELKVEQLEQKNKKIDGALTNSIDVLKVFQDDPYIRNYLESKECNPATVKKLQELNEQLGKRITQEMLERAFRDLRRAEAEALVNEH